MKTSDVYSQPFLDARIRNGQSEVRRSNYRVRTDGEAHIYAGELLPSAQQGALSDMDLALMKTIRAFNEEQPGFNPSEEMKAMAASAS